LQKSVKIKVKNKLKKQMSKGKKLLGRTELVRERKTTKGMGEGREGDIIMHKISQ
jgi:hypothetical protein